jgi:peptidoglycan/xylan/chitin deacetylase (PgdA/CDA1 family)
MKQHEDHHDERNRTNILFGLFISLLVILLVLFVTNDAPDKKIVLLSFDVEPVDGEASVMTVLDAIERENISVTFFVTGEYAASHPDIVERMAGQEVGVHGYTHKPFTKMDNEEKISEISMTRNLLENITGQSVIGFRAPYNRIDSKTLDVLESEGFRYDASMISGWGIFYPNIGDRDIGEVPVSSVLGLPLEDVVFLYYLRMPSLFFYIIENKKSGLESYLFHPHHIAEHINEFDDFINRLKKENTIFISHRELIEQHNEGV